MGYGAKQRQNFSKNTHSCLLWPILFSWKQRLNPLPQSCTVRWPAKALEPPALPVRFPYSYLCPPWHASFQHSIRLSSVSVCFTWLNSFSRHVPKDRDQKKKKIQPQASSCVPPPILTPPPFGLLPIRTPPHLTPLLISLSSLLSSHLCLYLCYVFICFTCWTSSYTQPKCSTQVLLTSVTLQQLHLFHLFLIHLQKASFTCYGKTLAAADLHPFHPRPDTILDITFLFFPFPSFDAL